jgi:hypothetical protein
MSQQQQLQQQRVVLNGREIRNLQQYCWVICCCCCFYFIMGCFCFLFSASLRKKFLPTNRYVGCVRKNNIKHQIKSNQFVFLTKQQTTNNKQQTTNKTTNNQQTTNNKQQTTNNKQQQMTKTRVPNVWMPLF